MNISTELYDQSLNRIPKTGQHILAYQNDESIVVYQAYNSAIADFAIKNQYLGGPDYSYSRMSWIKPNFLLMMFRCGWAEKENQERVLALWISKIDFESILNEAVFSSYHQNHYESQEQWKSELQTKEVRLQWDPDHDPFGNKVERRAIQLGLKGTILEKFGRQHIQRIEDITAFAKEQKQVLNNKQLEKLQVPIETIFKMQDDRNNKRIGIN